MITIIPVFALLLLGAGFRKTDFLSSSTIRQLKSLVVQFTLPSLLFLAFWEVDLDSDGVFLVSLIFMSCIILLFLGNLLTRLFWPTMAITKYLFTGFEAGMLGYALFISVFGSKNLGVFATVDLGQVVFVFLIMVPLLNRTAGITTSFRKTIINAVQSPVILAIFSGLVLGMLNRFISFEYSWGFEVLTSVFSVVGSLTVPLICICVGYDLHITPQSLKDGLGITLARLGINCIFAGIFTLLILTEILKLPRIYISGIWILFILPPPFVIPVFLGNTNEQEKAEAGFISSVLSVHTLITVLLVPFLTLLQSFV